MKKIITLLLLISSFSAYAQKRTSPPAYIADLTSKVTKGGDTGGGLTFGTKEGASIQIITDNIIRWNIDRTYGYLARGGVAGSAGIHLYGLGDESTIAFGNDLNVTIRERNGEDNDQMEVYPQNGFGVFTGAKDNTPDLWVNPSGNTVLGGETAVAGNKLSVIGNTNIAGNLTITGFKTYKDTGTPPDPAVGECNTYMKDDKFIIQSNDGGTVRYRYLDLTGTGVTWVHSLVEP